MTESTHCPLIEKCPFFHAKLQNMPATAESLMSEYCERDFPKCARFRVRGGCGGDAVPLSLFPNDHERARTILAQCQQ